MKSIYWLNILDNEFIYRLNVKYYLTNEQNRHERDEPVRWLKIFEKKKEKNEKWINRENVCRIITKGILTDWWDAGNRRFNGRVVIVIGALHNADSSGDIFREAHNPLRPRRYASTSDPFRSSIDIVSRHRSEAIRLYSPLQITHATGWNKDFALYREFFFEMFRTWRYIDRHFDSTLG